MPKRMINRIDANTHQEFHVSWAVIAYKFLFGLFESLSGIGILIWGTQAYDLFLRIVSKELTEDPHDVLANLTIRFVPNLLLHHTFLAIYLILLGVVKLAGVVGLIRQKNWGVDLLVGLTILMIPFQTISIIGHPDVMEILYFSFGLFIALYLVNFRPLEWMSRISASARSQLVRTIR